MAGTRQMTVDLIIVQQSRTSNDGGIAISNAGVRGAVSDGCDSETRLMRRVHIQRILAQVRHRLRRSPRVVLGYNRRYRVLRAA